MLCAGTLAATTVTARADDGDAHDDWYLPIGSLGQVGLGLAHDVRERGERKAPTEETPVFNGSLGFGLAWQAVGRLHAGGFVEARTRSFGTFEGALGLQAQVQLAGTTGLRLRAGGGRDITSAVGYSLVGLELGSVMAGVSVTHRHYLDDGHDELSVNLELGLGILLGPYLVSHLPVGGD